MDQPLAEVQCAGQRLVHSRVVLRVHIHLGHRELNGVLLEARQPWPLRSRNVGSIHTEGLETLLGRPFGEVGVVTLAGDDEWREQGNSLSLVIAQQAAAMDAELWGSMATLQSGQCCVPSFTYNSRRK